MEWTNVLALEWQKSTVQVHPWLSYCVLFILYEVFFYQLYQHLKTFISDFHWSKCARLGNGKQSRMVCFLNNTDSRNYCRDVSGGMASICHLHSSNCSLHMVSGMWFFFLLDLSMTGQRKSETLPSFKIYTWYNMISQVYHVNNESHIRQWCNKVKTKTLEWMLQTMWTIYLNFKSNMLNRIRKWWYSS